MKSRVIEYLKVIEEEKEISEQLVPFDEVLGDGAGSLPKGFAMVKGSSIMELYDIIRANQNTHYQFCGCDYILNSSRQEFANMNFSAVIRRSRKDTDFATAEKIGSRVAEEFGVDCPYIAPLGKTNRFVASLDFLKYGEEMSTFEEYTNAIFNRQASICGWIRVFLRALEKDKRYSGTTQKQKSGLIKEIIRHYIVRRFLLKDNDFNCGNLAVVCGKTGLPKLVSFDFEFCLNNSIVFDRSGGLPADFMERNIAEVIREYPQEFYEVLQELQMTPDRYNKILGIMEGFLEDKEMAKNWTKSMDTTISLLNYYQQKYSLDKVM